MRAGSPAAKGVQPVYSCDPELLARLGARRAGGDGAQAQTLVVTETRLFYQLLHGGLLGRSQSAARWRLAIIRYCRQKWQEHSLIVCFRISTLTPLLLVNFSHLIGHRHRDRSSGCFCLPSSVSSDYQGPSWSFQPFWLLWLLFWTVFCMKHKSEVMRREESEGFQNKTSGSFPVNRKLWSNFPKAARLTWGQCFALSALEGSVEGPFVLLRRQRSWRRTEDSGFSGGVSWRSPPSLSSLLHRKPLWLTAREIHHNSGVTTQQYVYLRIETRTPKNGCK